MVKNPPAETKLRTAAMRPWKAWLLVLLLALAQLLAAASAEGPDEVLT